MESKPRVVIGVMGGARVDASTEHTAEKLGMRIAKEGWVLLTGGRPVGVMQAASRGAAAAGGLVIGVLPGKQPGEANPHVDIAIATGLADGRNLVNVLSSQVIIACPGGTGTLSEVALAIKNRRPVVLLGFDPGPLAQEAEQNGMLARVNDPDEAIEAVREFLSRVFS